MSQGLSSLVPNLSLEDHIYQAEELITATGGAGAVLGAGHLPGRGPSPDSHSIRSCESCCMEVEPTERGRLEVCVLPAAFTRSDSYQCSQVSAYPMHRRPRGLALIIDISLYENDVQDARLGSDVDVDNLRALLAGLQFDVAVHRNLGLGQFYKEVTEFCCNKMHAEADMAVVVILSHGRDGVVYAADGQSINMEYIYEFFNNRNCPLLRGKPKFFIVQACRGDRPDPGMEREEGAGVVTGKRRRSRATLDGVVGAGEDEESSLSRARPTWEDMIIAYSTIPGYASLRDHDRGTWFVQSLVEVFMSHAHDTELVDLLRMTSERLSHFTNEMGEKQTCNVEMRHLYKRIYFNPGLGSPASQTSQPGVFSPDSSSQAWDCPRSLTRNHTQ